MSCNNPFYAISAYSRLSWALGFVRRPVSGSQTWALMTGMAGYTLILAVTACLLVRWLGVWDDVRTVLLLTVLMFLATSVTFDEVLAVAPLRGIACFLGGLAFAVVVSEGMLPGSRAEIASGLPGSLLFHPGALLSLPVALVPLLDQPRSLGLEWALFGFSPAAGLVALTLLPAVKREPLVCPGQWQPLALGLVSLDPLRRAWLRGPGPVGTSLLVNAPPVGGNGRAVYLRTVFSRAFLTRCRAPSARDRACRASRPS